MGVSVLGDTAQAWLVAAHASASSGEIVGLVDADAGPGRVALEVRYPDRRRRATIEVVPEPRAADACVIVAAADLDRQHEALASNPSRLAGRIVVLAPGGAGGAVRAAATFAAASVPVPALAEVPGFPVLGAVTGGTATISAVKRHLPIGVLEATDASAVTESVGPYLPDLVLAESVLATSLANTNNVVHPPLAILNAARIDAGVPFRFYRDGLSVAAAQLVEAVDHERLSVTDAVRLERVPIAEWFRRYYGDQGLAGDGIGPMLGTFEAFAESPGPATLRHRYLVDDVRSGLAVIEAVGQRLGLRMPVTAALCEIVSRLVGLDLRAGSADLASELLERGRTAPSSPASRRGVLASAGSRERS
ncbi:MAG: NAD/NADP octopine/nopaline dehydrogenase family protein [Chloroflexota bacterium]